MATSHPSLVHSRRGAPPLARLAALVVALTLIGSFVFTSAASAVESGPACETGTLTADGLNCEIEGSPPVAGPSTCPVGPDVGGEPGGCYEISESTPGCVAPATLTTDGRCYTPVDAVPGAQFCPEPGFGLVDGQCVRFGAPATEQVCDVGNIGAVGETPKCLEFEDATPGSTDCPTTSDQDSQTVPVYGSPGGCFWFAKANARTATCVTPYVPNASECFFEVPNPTDQTCPDVPAGLTTWRSNQTLPDGTVVTVRCTYLDDAACTAGFPAQLGGLCGRPVADDVSSGQCPLGYVLETGYCATYLRGTEPADAALCLTIVGSRLFADKTCQVHRVPLAPAGATACPIMTEVFGSPGSCIEYRFSFGQCPTGSAQDANSGCRMPVADVVTEPSCNEGFDYDSGFDQCVRFSDPRTVFTCDGVEVAQGDFCLIVGAPPISGPSTCPIGPDVLGTPPDCHTLTPQVPVCDEGATLVANECRTPVPDIAGAEFCPDAGFGLVDGRCIRFAAAEVRCDGQVVTINMLAGDSGIGTDGDDVILGTPGADIIDAGAGDDIICAGSGADDIRGGSGADRIFGERGKDKIRGGAGADLLKGGAGKDTIRGGGGADVIVGGAGTDTCFGGGGTNQITRCEN